MFFESEMDDRYKNLLQFFFSLVRTEIVFSESRLDFFSRKKIQKETDIALNRVALNR